MKPFPRLGHFSNFICNYCNYKEIYQCKFAFKVTILYLYKQGQKISEPLSFGLWVASIIWKCSCMTNLSVTMFYSSSVSVPQHLVTETLIHDVFRCISIASNHFNKVITFTCGKKEWNISQDSDYSSQRIPGMHLKIKANFLWWE